MPDPGSVIYSGSSFRAKYLVTKDTRWFFIHNDNGRKYQHFELLYAEVHPRATWLRRSYSPRLADLSRLSEKISGRSVRTNPAGFGEFGAHTAPDETENPHFRRARINSVPFFKLYCHRQIPPQTLSRADFNDYVCATRKSNHCNEISQKTPLRPVSIQL